jgi:ribonuclease E
MAARPLLFAQGAPVAAEYCHMATRMLIDATHREETRVVVVDGNRLQEFDFETSTKKQLKGNIYLAKITRVEPSLQAAFVDYGGNRDGFLSFSEIHPDYYQIPIADRQALLEQEAAEEAETRESEDEAAERAADAAELEEDIESEGGNGVLAEDEQPEAAEPLDVAAEAAEGTVESDEPSDEEEPGDEDTRVATGSVEDVGGDALEEISRRPRRSQRPYKIQEVIKRRQILLVQVSKEERGNKGAALTTYLSLAGRYCVLMPNTARGGGISRKIVNAGDRKRLKDMVGGLDVTKGMGVIVRTAGMNRAKPEIKRDYDYLTRLWDDIREATLESTAPTLVYEEANLIKRSIRDLYDKDIKEILVEGDDGYKSAKTFIRMLMPSRAKVVQPYRDQVPLFHRYRVDEQFDALHSPVVNLKSGGYIVINSTEALVAIDVNSGRATRERNIEETALATNLEAAEELARQLRLRDLSGLIVIDFIDMESNRNNRSVERRLKDCLKHDRARLQVGRISAFGLLEMSRQRLRPSIVEASGESCPRCGGSGMVRSTESSTLHVLRAIEEEGLKQQSTEITVHVASPVALYLLNIKRDALAAIEQRYGMKVFVFGDDELVPPEMRVERQKTRPGAEPVETEAEAEEGERKRKRRSRRRKRPEDEAAAEEAAVEAEAEEETAEEAAAEASDEVGDTDTAPKRRRRGKRGGRRRSRAARDSEAAETTTAEGDEAAAETEAQEAPEAEAEGTAEAATEAAEKPKRSRRGGRGRSRKPKADQAVQEESAAQSPAAAVEAGVGEAEISVGAEALETVGAAEAPPEVAPPGAGVGEDLIVAASEPPAALDEEAETEVIRSGGEETLPPPPAEQTDAEPKSRSRRGWWRRPFVD